MDLSQFIYDNIKKELMDLGHSAQTASSCAESAKYKYENGSNWRMGTVYAELSKEAKKAAGKAKKKTGDKK